MKEWKDDKALFALIKEELYTAVVGDIMDKMGYTRQFLPPRIRPLRDDMLVAGRAMTVLEADVLDAGKEKGMNPVLKRSFGLMLEALDDLKAKVLGVPCYELLGGAYRKDILLYANYWFTGGGHNEADYAAQARRVMDAGFTGLKFDPFAHTNYFYGEDLASNLTLTAEQQDLAFNVSKAVREAVGPECDIMIETHAMLNYRVAVKMAERLAKLDITWYEEPAGPESSQTLRAMRERIPSDVAICVGERHYTRFGIRSLLEKHVCDVIMPDITRCGGPSEMKRMATMAEAYNVLIAPHNPNGPLSTLASSHVCAAIPNFFRQEFMFNDVPWRDTVIDHPIAEMVYDGHLHLSDRPGLGVDLVEEEMEKHPGITTDAPDNFYI